MMDLKSILMSGLPSRCSLVQSLSVEAAQEEHIQRVWEIFGGW